MTRKKTKAGTGLGSSKSKVNITLTPEANDTLVALAKETGLTKSKFFEEILVGGIVINSQNAETKVVLNKQDGDQKFSIAKLEDSDEDSVNKSDSGSISAPNNAIEQEIKNQQKKIAELEEQINKQKNLVADKSRANEDLESKLQHQQDKIKVIESELEQKNSQIKTLEKDLKDALASNNNDDLKDLNKARESISKLEQKIATLESLVAEREAEIQALKNDIAQGSKKNSNSEELKSLIKAQQEEINNYRQKIAHQEQEKIALSQSHAVKQSTLIQGLTQENAEQKALIVSLNQRIADLEPRASIGDRFLNKWR